MVESETTMTNNQRNEFDPRIDWLSDWFFIYWSKIRVYGPFLHLTSVNPKGEGIGGATGWLTWAACWLLIRASTRVRSYVSASAEKWRDLCSWAESTSCGRSFCITCKSTVERQQYWRETERGEGIRMFWREREDEVGVGRSGKWREFVITRRNYELMLKILMDNNKTHFENPQW